MKNNNLLTHFVVAALASFAVSSGAWIFLASLAQLGSGSPASAPPSWSRRSVGHAGKNLITTLAATLRVRGAILFFAVNG